MCKQSVFPINLPGIGEKLFRALNLRGGVNPDGVGSVVDASITVADLTTAEYAWLARSKRYWQAFSIAAVAGQNSSFEVRNLAQSGVLTIVEDIELVPFGSSGIGLFMSTVADLGLTTVTRNCAKDGRQEEAGVLSTPAMITQVVGGASLAGIPGNASFITAAANTTYRIPGPFVLKSGTYLRCRVGTTNVGMDVRLNIRERMPTPSELT